MMDSRLTTLLLFIFSVSIETLASSECGDPQETYVSWDNLRHYANKFHDAGISPFALGDSLPVARCGNCYNVCDRTTHCGIKTQEYVTRIVNFTQNERDQTMKISYLQDKECQCVAKNMYLGSCEPTKVPPIVCVLTID